MRNEIVASWKRCELAGVRRTRRHAPERLNSKEIHELKNKHSLLLSVASPIIQDLHDFVYGSGFLTLLTTYEGIILEVLDDPGTSLFTSEFQLVPGAVWKESEIGTSAIGVSIYEKKPFQVAGDEHYWEKLHDMTCSAAPICGPRGEPLGILNVSGPKDSVHSHTLGMVVSAAKAIERQFKLTEITKEIQQSNETLNTLLNVVEDGVIMVDESFLILQSNQRGADILKQKQPKYLIGKKITRFFSNSRLYESILSQNPLQDELMRVESPDIHCLVQVRPIETIGNRIAAVIIFREVQHIQRLARSIEGNKAYITMKELRGSSRAMDELREQVRLVAQSDVTTLLLGETGSGKEMVAQSIHNISQRKDKPFIVVNCAALPRTLLESELFGYERGTFTGGLKQGKPGKFELADGGTIFLDEIGEMSPDLQVILLRVLQERRITRLGGNKPIPVDVRIIAATNKDLVTAIDEGTFRADLYYRLNILRIDIPPLRIRVQDISELVNWFVTKDTPRGVKPKKFTNEAMTVLQHYHWPGNVRELENIVQRCIVMTDQDVIGFDDIPPSIHLHAGITSSNALDSTMKKVKKTTFLKAYHQVNGDLSETADLLGISRATAYRWAKKFLQVHNG